MNKGKKIALLSVSLVLLVSLIALFLWRHSARRGGEEKAGVEMAAPVSEAVMATGSVKRISYEAVPTNEKTCAAKASPEERDYCLKKIKYNEVFREGTVEDCLLIDDYDLRNQCIYQMVIPHGSVENCSRIADHKLKELCLGMAGIDRRSEAFCEIFKDEPHEKQECVDRVRAFRAGDSGIADDCAGVETLEYGSLCRLKGLEKSGKSCNDLKDESNREACLSEVLFSKAISRDDCLKVPGNDYRSVCIDIFDNVQNKNYRFDPDGDGLSHTKELWLKTDPFKADTDGDGLLDPDELGFSNPSSPDTDSDGLADFEERKAGTSPQKPDTDGDGILDGADGDPLDKTNDADGDRVSNADEDRWGTDKDKKDSDADSISDFEEIRNGTNPLGEGWKQDTDKDGLIDVDEIFYLTDRLDSDSDGDGIGDKEDAKNGFKGISAD